MCVRSEIISKDLTGFMSSNLAANKQTPVRIYVAFVTRKSFVGDKNLNQYDFRRMWQVGGNDYTPNYAPSAPPFERTPSPQFSEEEEPPQQQAQSSNFLGSFFGRGQERTHRRRRISDSDSSDAETNAGRRNNGPPPPPPAPITRAEIRTMIRSEVARQMLNNQVKPVKGVLTTGGQPDPYDPSKTYAYIKSVRLEVSKII
jgi:hypothetical protein